MPGVFHDDFPWPAKSFLFGDEGTAEIVNRKPDDPRLLACPIKSVPDRPVVQAWKQRDVITRQTLKDRPGLVTMGQRPLESTLVPHSLHVDAFNIIAQVTALEL